MRICCCSAADGHCWTKRAGAITQNQLQLLSTVLAGPWHPAALAAAAAAAVSQKAPYRQLGDVDEALCLSTHINKGTKGLDGGLQGRKRAGWFRELQL